MSTIDEAARELAESLQHASEKIGKDAGPFRTRAEGEAWYQQNSPKEIAAWSALIAAAMREREEE